MPRRGKSMEQLVAAIEKALGDNRNVTVESPKHLTDRTTARPREHDVVLTYKQGHHCLRVAMECRDRRRAVTVNDVESFSKKCEETGIDKGIIVSSSGFYGTARKKAHRLNLECLEIQEVDHLTWFQTGDLLTITSTLLSSHWVFFPGQEGISQQSKCEVLDSAGKALSASALQKAARLQVEEHVRSSTQSTSEATLELRFNGSGLSLHDIDTGKQVPVARITATIRYAVAREMTPFRRMQYVDNREGNTIAEMAVGEVKSSLGTASVMFLQNQDKSTSILLMPKSGDHKTKSRKG